MRFVLLFAAATIMLLVFGVAPARAADATYELETAFDSWIPTILWGGLLIFCLWLAGDNPSAWFPASMALMNLAASIITPPVYGREASIMFFLVAFIIHAIIVTVRNLRSSRKDAQ